MRSAFKVCQFLGLLALAALLSGCSSGVGRGLLQLDVASASPEPTAALTTLNLAKRDGVSTNMAMRDALQHMAAKLARAVNADDVGFNVVLLRNDKVNAFTPGAGNIIVNEGLLRFAQSEGQVAAVLAHEMAHVLMNHPSRQRQINLASAAGSRWMDRVTPQSLQESLGRALRLSGNATMTGMIRQQELMADSIGIDIMAKAGYEPRQLVAILQLLREANPQPDRLRNIIYGQHPLNIDREVAALHKIERNYGQFTGVVSTARFDRLLRDYHAGNKQRVALR